MSDDDDVEELENESEAVRKEPTIEKSALVSAPPKDAERQLSKKELKKKEMAELDALLHEMGIANKDSNTTQNETARWRNCKPTTCEDQGYSQWPTHDQTLTRESRRYQVLRRELNPKLKLNSNQKQMKKSSW
ncbi:uncharacterized protein LOC122013944 [Zingiber officinale]|uniref:uncharacterized protein LOC122013944 n=1 Tax=Zingiber officinale TaxID=94328 RepID=UPI001C4C3565|nr:uncharacterized protein LOC122013944 [Zingiber officinale]